MPSVVLRAIARRLLGVPFHSAERHSAPSSDTMNPPRKRAATKRSPVQATAATFVSFGVHAMFEGSQTSPHVWTDPCDAAGSFGARTAVGPTAWKIPSGKTATDRPAPSSATARA